MVHLSTLATASGDREPHPIEYQGWTIVPQSLGKQFWLRCQHPDEDFPRYGLRVEANSWRQRLREVRQLIDTIQLLETQQHATVPKA